MKFPSFFILSLLILSFCINACYYDVAEELYPAAEVCDSLSVPSFSSKVNPILDQHCTSCHGGNSPTAGVGLDSYQGVRDAVEDGTLECSIYHLGGCEPMPDNSPKIPQCQLLEISRWIDSGYNED